MMNFDPQTSISQLSSWRKLHGFVEARVCEGHTCAGKCNMLALSRSIFVCERTGWAHICDDTCKERFIDPATELPVCPISGRCFELMMSEEVGLSGFCSCGCAILLSIEPYLDVVLHS